MWSFREMTRQQSLQPIPESVEWLTADLMDDDLDDPTNTDDCGDETPPEEDSVLGTDEGEQFGTDEGEVLVHD